MVIFHSYVKLPEDNFETISEEDLGTTNQPSGDEDVVTMSWWDSLSNYPLIMRER